MRNGFVMALLLARELRADSRVEMFAGGTKFRAQRRGPEGVHAENRAGPVRRCGIRHPAAVRPPVPSPLGGDRTESSAEAWPEESTKRSRFGRIAAEKILPQGMDDGRHRQRRAGMARTRRLHRVDGERADRIDADLVDRAPRRHCLSLLCAPAFPRSCADADPYGNDRALQDERANIRKDLRQRARSGRTVDLAAVAPPAPDAVPRPARTVCMAASAGSIPSIFPQGQKNGDVIVQSTACRRPRNKGGPSGRRPGAPSLGSSVTGRVPRLTSNAASRGAIGITVLPWAGNIPSGRGHALPAGSSHNSKARSLGKGCARRVCTAISCAARASRICQTGRPRPSRTTASTGRSAKSGGGRRIAAAVTRASPAMANTAVVPRQQRVLSCKSLSRQVLIEPILARRLPIPAP